MKPNHFLRILSKDQSGVTLIELIVIVAIVGILSAVAISNILNYRVDANFRATTAQLVGDIQRAKGQAIRANANVVFQYSATGYTVFIDNGASGDDWTHQADEVMISTVSFTPDISINLGSSTFTNNRTRFDGRGVPGTIGTVVIEGPSSNQANIAVSRLGRIKTT